MITAVVEFIIEFLQTALVVAALEALDALAIQQSNSTLSSIKDNAIEILITTTIVITIIESAI